MAKPYFRQVPDFNYVSRLPNAMIGDYIAVKNFFKRVQLRGDIFGDLTFFTQYKILGDERPDNVAHKIYNDSTYDWIVLLSNNIPERAPHERLLFALLSTTSVPPYWSTIPLVVAVKVYVYGAGALTLSLSLIHI